jgi:hypothetical protein
MLPPAATDNHVVIGVDDISPGINAHSREALPVVLCAAVPMAALSASGVE